MAAIRDGIISLLYPRRAVCIACGALRVDDERRALCAACANALTPIEAPFCPRCGVPGWAGLCPACVILPPDALDARLAAYTYEDTARLLVRALKYEHVKNAAIGLSDGMLALLPTERFDGIVPIPLHRKRRRQRGFNQAEALSLPLSRATGIPLLNALSRTRGTRTQTKLSREGRLRNVRGAFKPAMAVNGLSLVLVDDVLTTGATALSCAEALKAAGARRVTLLAAARAGLHDA